jgi:signal transduction histidine kinase
VAVFPPARKERLENVVQLPGYRYVRHRIKVPGAGPIHVRIGMSTASRDASVLALTKSLAPAGLALALLTPLAGYWLAVRATRPIAGIVHTAASLRPTRLGDRLAVRGSGDELDQLAETINRLLDQVADHVDRQRQFLADAAHELRGPLAAIRSSLECTVSRERSADEYRTALGDVLEETAHLATLTNDLLLLAEADHEPAAGASATVDIDLIARDAVAMFGAAAEDRGIDLHVMSVPPMVTRGDAAQFRRVIGNLLDNAIRFTPAGGRVRVSLSSAGDDGAVLLEIRDTGIGIAPADVPRVFDRFFKADPARTRGGDRGGGLGLPICRAIVERHGGTIAVASEPGRGTTVTVRLHRAGGYAPVETPPRLPTQMAQLAQRAPIQFAGGGTRSP